jgi:hypothetical protein
VIIIVTGSRDWDLEFKIKQVLNEFWALADVLDSPLIIKHGVCPTGADLITEQWAVTHENVTVQHFPANWKVHGKAAGPRRNEAMVDSGADLCVAFLRGSSPGTSSTISLARTAKIPTFVIAYPTGLL